MRMTPEELRETVDAMIKERIARDEAGRRAVIKVTGDARETILANLRAYRRDQSEK